MPTLSLRTNGLDKVMTGFNQYAATITPITREDTAAALEKAKAKSPGWLGGSAYTTPEAGYVRTGNLGISTMVWQEGISSRLTVAAYSREGYEYGHLVVGNADGGGQGGPWAAIGWVTLRDAVDEQIDILTRKGGPLDSDLQSSAGKAGL